MEPLEDGNQLLDYIEQQEEYSEADVAGIIGTVLRAVLYVHEKGQAYNYIRPQNIWLPSSGDFSGLKLSGFSVKPFYQKVNRIGSAE